MNDKNNSFFIIKELDPKDYKQQMKSAILAFKWELFS
jgi:hypothetical protein